MVDIEQHAGSQNVATTSLKQLTMIVYLLQALGFITGITSIAGVVINYIKLDNVRGTWLESHFRWQIRTFWFGLLWAVIGLVLMVVIVGYFIILANMVWIIYRIAKGWIKLYENKPVD